MFVLGVRFAQYLNGVSELHGRVARRMWSHAWPKRSEDEIPITHVTNGVHVPTWISYEFALLFERYLGPDWSISPWKKDISKRIEEIYNEELWRAHEMNRSRLIRTCRELMKQQYQRRNAPKAVMDEVEAVLDQDILTIGFARRFASYKRAYLLLMDPERLEAIITSKTHPVQFIFSGKAHPKDREGKDLIRQLILFSQKKGVRHRFIFLENYDPHIARHLIQGADVWLNTPRRPYEACGTSGMKAALNGVLNISTLDGWWAEGYSESTGWCIGNGEEYSDHKYQDAVESQALYNILENDVIPLFYERKNGDLPLQWIKMMKAAMKMAMLRFSSHKMVENYGKRFYLPAASRMRGLVENEAAEAKRLSRQLDRLKAHWDNIQIKSPVMNSKDPLHTGATVHVTAEVHLGQLMPHEVSVDIYYGPLKTVETLQTSNTEKMTVKEDRGNGNYVYGCDLTLNRTGRYGFTCRVTPQGDDWVKFTPGLVTWAIP
ncbi:MAG: alpha-glucan family phosphorylase [Deltaproteobacteria bacterium]|nr:alpha-glucan family phosphorylase [Deltaproteobacteria bacterium]